MTVPNPSHIYPQFPDARLPVYPSVAALIHAITDDARQIAARHPYILNSSHWHSPMPQGTGCAICTAGAYAARRFELPPGTEIVPFCFPPNVRTVLHATDLLRRGYVNIALANFHRAIFHELDRHHIAPSQERLFGHAHQLFNTRLADCEAFHDTQSFDRHLDVLNELAAWLNDQPALHRQET